MSGQPVTLFSTGNCIFGGYTGGRGGPHLFAKQYYLPSKYECAKTFIRILCDAPNWSKKWYYLFPHFQNVLDILTKSTYNIVVWC